jgi:hypothetical protein
MNWDAIGAVGEVLGSVAVFITLGHPDALRDVERVLAQTP